MVTQKLVPRLAGLKARLQSLNTRLGRPNFTVVVLEYPTANFIVLGNAIEVTTIGERQMSEFRNSGIEVNVNDLVISRIPRTGVITRQMLQKGRYIIDATVNPQSMRWVGTIADAYFVNDKDDTSWTVTARVFRQR